MFETGAEVMIAMWVDPKRAAAEGRVVAERTIKGRRAYAVRHRCGKLRTWFADELLSLATRATRRA